MKAKETASIVLLSMFPILPQLSQAQQQSPFYQKKTIQVVIGSAPGGLYDRWARLFAQHMGNPAILISFPRTYRVGAR
jgi:tripartite-type tricarboxylate transporter receptor subunit TctC